MIASARNIASASNIACVSKCVCELRCERKYACVRVTLQVTILSEIFTQVFFLLNFAIGVGLRNSSEKKFLCSRKF